MGMRALRIAFAVLLLLLGGVWIGQGLGYIRGSFMTGSTTWLVIGVVVELLGLALLFGPRLLGKAAPRG